MAVKKEQSDVVQLSGAVVQWVKDKSSRENVFQVKNSNWAKDRGLDVSFT